VNAENDPSFRDKWGEPEPRGSSAADRTAPRVRLKWILAAIALILTLAGAYFGLKHTVVWGLSASCREALRAKDWDRLEDSAARWRAWERTKAAPLIYLAEVANQDKQYERVVELLDELPDDDPMTPPALVEQSTFLFEELNHPIAGAESLQRAVRLDPMLAEARRRLVYFYAFTLQRRKMVEEAYDAIRHDCDFPETYVYLMGRDWLSCANAYAENTKWMRGKPDEELFLVARAISRIKIKALDELDDAQLDGPAAPDGTPYHRKVIGEYFQRFPHNLELLAYYLERATVNGDIEEVTRLLSQATPEATADNRFWRYRGWLHAAQGQLGEAEECYRKALAINPYDYLTRHHLASVQRRLKRLDQVKDLEDLSLEGKELRKRIVGLQSVNKIPPVILKGMLQYAKKCGDDIAASQLEKRLDYFIRIWDAQAKKVGK
jgi:tetratricopeptide (TPR) repeat protein